jgi:hypothetical protein
MSQGSVVNRAENHWTQSDSSGGNHRATWIFVLSLLAVVGTAVMVWYVLRAPRAPQTFLAAWYFVNYDDSVLYDLPFAEQCAMAVASTSPARGAGNVRLISSPLRLQGNEQAVQAAGDLLGRLRPQGSHPINAELDSVLLYIRAYATGTVTDSGEVQADLIAANFHGTGLGGRLPLKTVFDKLAALPASAIVVMLDTSEIEHELSLGILANGFPKSLEAMLAENRDWSRLWVVNSNSLLQPAHVSWSQRQTLLTAAVTPEDWAGEDLNRDGWVSLSEFYERTLRFCDFQTNGQQTPLLLRGGHGLCRPAPGDAAWQHAQSIQLIRTVAIPQTESEDAAVNAADLVTQPQRPVVMARTVALRPVAQEQTESNGSEDKSDKTEQTQVGPASDGGVNRLSNEPQDRVDSSASDSQRVAKSFDQSPREAMWAVRDRLIDRKAAGQWSPIDYAPGFWNIIQRELIALDRQERMRGSDDSASSGTESGMSQWRQYYELFRYLLEPGNQDKPRLASQAAINLLSVWESKQWQRRRQLWASDEELRPGDRQGWKEIQQTLRLYCDAVAELTWWLDLAAGVRSDKLIEKSDAMRRVLLDACVDMELDNIDPRSDHGPITSHRVAMELARNELEAVLASLVDRPARDLSRGQSWLRARQIDHLLRSPLVRWEARQKLEKQLAELGPGPLVITREKELIAVWNRGRQNNGDDGLGGWGYYGNLAKSHDDLWALIDRFTTEVGAGRPQVRDTRTLHQWGQRYLQRCENADSLWLERKPAAFDVWRLAAISGPKFPRRVLPTTVEPALVIAPVLDPLRVFPKSPEVLTLLRINQPERFQPLTLAIPGGAPPEQCVIRLTIPAANRWDESLRLKVEDRVLDWGKLRSEGESVVLQRGGRLNLAAVATQSMPGLSPREHLELELAVGGEKVKVSLTIEPPRPDHVDLWVTTAGDKGIESGLARRSQGAETDEAFQSTEWLARERALVAIPSGTAGVPYRFWVVNQSREARAVRARIYPVSPPAGVILRPGRLTDRRFGQIPESVRLEVLDGIRRGSVRPWVEAIAELPVADGAETAEPTLPNNAVPLLFRAISLAGTDAEKTDDLDVPHGFLCLLQEVVKAPGGDDPAASLWVNKMPSGGVWEKWIEITSHFMEGEGKASRWDKPLVEITPVQYDTRRSELQFAVRGKPNIWARYGIESLPLEVTATSDAAADFKYQGKKQWELTPSEPEANVNLLIRGTQPVETQSHLIDLSVGDFPRRVSYRLNIRGQAGFNIVRREDPTVAELLTIEPVTVEGEVLSAESPKDSTLVLLNWHDVEGKRVEVKYQHIRAAARFDAPWTKFQDFDEAPENWDRGELVLRKENGGRERVAKVFSPRSERYHLQADTQQGVVKVIANITDQTGLKLDLNAEELEQGVYELFARLVFDGEIKAKSKLQRLVVDRTPPPIATVSKFGVANGEIDDPNSLWEGEKLIVQLKAVDELTQIAGVQFRLMDASGKPTGLIWAAVQIDPLDAVQIDPLGIWAATIDSGKLGGAGLPDARYSITATSVDLAGNAQENNEKYEFSWHNRPKPVAQPIDPAVAAGDAAAMAAIEKAKTYPVALTFTRNDGFVIEENRMDTVKVKNLPGAMRRVGNQIRFDEVPEGNYEVEVTATWYKVNFVAKHSISVPGDVQNGAPIKINLLPEKKLSPEK